MDLNFVLVSNVATMVYSKRWWWFIYILTYFAISKLPLKLLLPSNCKLLEWGLNPLRRGVTNSSYVFIFFKKYKKMEKNFLPQVRKFQNIQVDNIRPKNFSIYCVWTYSSLHFFWLLWLASDTSGCWSLGMLCVKLLHDASYKW